jgi:sugar/nucleoside kinase (ribokinase family)
MNPYARNLRKPFDLAALSTFTIETIDQVDGLPRDGRANLLQELPDQPGGLAYHSLHGIRSFDQDAELAHGGLVGSDDQEWALSLVRHLGAHNHLLPVPGKRTNRSQVLLGPEDEKLIMRRQQAIHFAQDLDRQQRRRFLGMISQSRACLLGNLPLELTGELIDFGRHVGTYISLGAGGSQLGHLANLKPHALFLNFPDAQQATGLYSDDGTAVFARLLEVVGAEHVVVMTGGRSRPVHVAERLSRLQWTLDPVDVSDLRGRNGFLNPLGAGDTLAGAATLLLGRHRRLLTGETVLEAVRFAQEVAVAHVTGDDWLLRRLRARYTRMRPLFEPEPVGEKKSRQAG